MSDDRETTTNHFVCIVLCISIILNSHFLRTLPLNMVRFLFGLEKILLTRIERELNVFIIKKDPGQN